MEASYSKTLNKTFTELEACANHSVGIAIVRVVYPRSLGDPGDPPVVKCAFQSESFPDHWKLPVGELKPGEII